MSSSSPTSAECLLKFPSYFLSRCFFVFVTLLQEVDSRLFTGTWETYQWLQHWEKYSFPFQQPLSIALGGGTEPYKSLSHSQGNVDRPCLLPLLSRSHCWLEFMSKMARLGPENTIPQPFPSSSGLCVLLLPFLPRSQSLGGETLMSCFGVSTYSHWAFLPHRSLHQSLPRAKRSLSEQAREKHWIYAHKYKHLGLGPG